MKSAIRFALFLAVSLQADQWNQELTFTFNEPIQIPGKVLEPGTYLFEVGVGQTSNDREVVRVYNKDKSRLHGLFLTVPDDRFKRGGKPIVMFDHAVPGSPEAIEAWFYPNRQAGHEFVYPKSEAVQLAKLNNRTVPSMPDEMMNEKGIEHAHLKGEKPTGEEVEIITTSITERSNNR